MELGKKIANLRKMKKVTQTQLAEYLAVQPQTISRWEAEGGMPDIMLLPKIASFFEVTIDELFGVTDMEQINHLVYKYSVLRDEKSFEEVMRSIEMAWNSCKVDLDAIQQKEAKEINAEQEVIQRMQQLKAWKVHIYIQKSRGALQKAEEELDELRQEIEPENPLYLPLKLQKQQFRIQMGETKAIVKQARSDWEEQKEFNALYCYMAALFDAQRNAEILQLWELDEVQCFVKDVDEKNEVLWQMLFESAGLELNLHLFESYFQHFRKKASERGIFIAQWELAKLYQALGMETEKQQLKKILAANIEKQDMNAYIKEQYMRKIKEM